jgi:hypothetical protein
LASLLLKRRLKTQAEVGRTEGQRGAADILRDLAGLPIGDAQERLGFLSALRERGLIAGDEVVRYWKDGALQEVKMVSTEIHREPEASDLPRICRWRSSSCCTEGHITRPRQPRTLPDRCRTTVALGNWQGPRIKRIERPAPSCAG